MKKISLLLVLSILISMLSFNILSAEALTTGTCGGKLEWSISDNVLTIKGEGLMDDYTSETPWNSFSDKITEIVIENGVESLGNTSFSKFKNVKTVSLPETLVYIGNFAFENCESLVEINIPDSVNSIGWSAFVRCRSLKKVFLPKNILVLELKIFSECSALEFVEIPDTVKEIRQQAFYNCSSLESITIPNSVEFIESSAFYGCKALEKITLSDEIIRIGGDVFDETAFYDDPKNWENGILYCGKYLIEADANSIEEHVTLRKDTRVITDDAFWGCDNLKSVVLNSELKAVGRRTFYNCSSLENVSVGNEIIEIGEEAFLNTAFYNDLNNWENDVLYLENYLLKAKSAGMKKIYSIKEGTTVVCENSFYGCINLEGIVFPESLKYINANSFKKCQKLKEVKIPDNVLRIGKNAFEDCENLKTVSFGNSLEIIDNYAFSGCMDVEQFSFPDSLEYMGDFAFMGCSSIKNLFIGKSVKHIGNFSFFLCYNLEKIAFSSSVRYIGEGAFAGKNNISDVVIPSQIEFMGKYSFGYWYEAGGIYSKVANYFMCAEKGSVAEKYSESFGMFFYAFDKEQTEYKFVDNTVIGVLDKTITCHMINNLMNQGEVCMISDENGIVNFYNEYVGTGSLVILSNGEQYKVVLGGDVDGSGKIDSTDYLRIKSYFLGEIELDETCMKAADINSDGKINTTDYLKIKSFFLGLIVL